jgi:integrase
LKFNLSKIITAGLTYIDDGQITSSNLENGEIVRTNIVFKEPYKIQVRISKMVNGKRIQNKKVFTFPPDTKLLNAVKECNKHYESMMNNYHIESISTSKDDRYSADMKLITVMERFVEYRKLEYESRTDKKEFDDNYFWMYSNRWIKPIYDKPIGAIDREDVLRLVNKVKQAGRSESYSRKVYQILNPVYKFFNLKASKFGVQLVSSATQISLPPLNNERGLNLSIEEIKTLFIELKEFQLSPAREIFMFLMHGRRRNEVLTLEWTDIDFQNNTYTVKAINNKARVNMTYHLSDRLKEALEAIGIEKNGYIFKRTNNSKLPYSPDALIHYWKTKEYKYANRRGNPSKYVRPITLHQIRNAIATYLKNEMGVGNDIVGQLLGHKQNKTVTDRYGKINYYTTGKYVDQMLDKIFDETPADEDEKFEMMKSLFPHKSDDEIRKALILLS